MSELDLAAENARLRDALDHIMRTARGSHNMSRRTRWIEARAHGALEGNDSYWKDIELPRNGERVRRRLEHEIEVLKAALEARAIPEPYPVRYVLTDADHMAVCANGLMESLNVYAAAEDAHSEHETQETAAAVDAASEDLAGRFQPLRNAIYEYRKRAQRYRDAVCGEPTKEPA